MEFSELFSFFIIFKESFNLFPKIWKITLPITLISLIFNSLFFCLLSTSYITLTHTMINSDSPFLYFFILLAVEIAFLLVFFACSRFSSISTIIVSASAYTTGHALAPSDLLARVRKTFRKPIKMRVRAFTIYMVLISVLIGSAFFFDLINPITIGLFIVLLTLCIVFELKSSVARAVALVVSIVEEENSDGSKAVERSEYLVQGQVLKGFMFNLVVNVFAIVCMLIFWLIMRDQGSMNLTVYGLFFVIFMGLFTVVVLVAYTVFYFQCKKYRGEEIGQVKDVQQYTKLPDTA